MIHVISLPDPSLTVANCQSQVVFISTGDFSKIGKSQHFAPSELGLNKQFALSQQLHPTLT